MKDIYDIRSAVFKAMAHPTRLKILELLGQVDEICVCDIAEKLKIDQPTISKHLSILKNVGLIGSRKEGLMVMYKLRAQCVNNFFHCVDNIIKTDLKAKVKHLNNL